MNYKRYITVLIFSLLIVNCCHSQNTIRCREFPKIKAKIDSLYPKASKLLSVDPSSDKDSTQLVGIKCNCGEASGVLFITFDTNGNILEKGVFISGKDLPDTIKYIMKRDTIKDYEFGGNIIKSINNKGDIFYSVYKWQIIPCDAARSGTGYYLLKYKSTGELVSKVYGFANI